MMGATPKHEEGEHLLLSLFASPLGVNPCAEATFIVHLQKRGIGATYSTLSTCFNQNHLLPGLRSVRKRSFRRTTTRYTHECSLLYN